MLASVPLTLVGRGVLAARVTVQVMGDVGAEDPGTDWGHLPALAAIPACLAATRAFLRERGVPFVASPGDAGPAGAPIVVLGGAAASRSSVAAAVTGGPARWWGASSPPMFVEFRFGATTQIRGWAAAAGRWPSRRVVVEHPAPLLEYLRVIDTPGLDGDGCGNEVLHAAVQQAAGVLVVVDGLPLPAAELAVLQQWSRACRTAVFAVADQPGRRVATTWLRDQLAEHVAEWAGAPCVPREDVTGLREALMSVAGPANLIRACYPLRIVRAAITEEWAHLQQRLRATRGHLTSTEIEKLAERAASAAPSRPDRSWVARPGTAAALGTAIDALREHFDDRAGGAELAELKRAALRTRRSTGRPGRVVVGEPRGQGRSRCPSGRWLAVLRRRVRTCCCVDAGAHPRPVRFRRGPWRGRTCGGHRCPEALAFVGQSRRAARRIRAAGGARFRHVAVRGRRPQLATDHR